MIDVTQSRLGFSTGETVPLTFNIVDADGDEYFMEDTDKLVLTLRKYADSDYDVLLTKTVTGTNTITLSATETALDPGAYNMTVQLFIGNEPYTIWGARSSNKKARNVDIYVGGQA